MATKGPASLLDADPLGSSRVRLHMPNDSKFQLRIASPCKAPWDEMHGDARVRFCRECEQSVYNLSAMTEMEARRLVAEREGRLCVRFYRRRDGTVLTSDCSIGRKRSWLEGSGRAVVAMALLAAGLGTLNGCADDYDAEQGYDDEEPLPTDEVLIGRVRIHDGSGEETAGVQDWREPEEIMGEILQPIEDSAHEE